jgi:hypothetical protein
MRRHRRSGDAIAHGGGGVHDSIGRTVGGTLHRILGGTSNIRSSPCDTASGATGPAGNARGGVRGRAGDTRTGRIICGGEDETFSDAETRDALTGSKIAAIEAKLAKTLPHVDARADSPGVEISEDQPPARRRSGRCRA